MATSESAKRLRCWQVLNSGFGADFGLRSGSSGSGARYGLPSCANGAWVTIWPLKRLVAPSDPRRLLREARAFLRRLAVPLRQESGLPEHSPHAGRAHRHDVSIQHHERQPTVALQRFFRWNPTMACFSHSSSQKSRGTQPLCSFTTTFPGPHSRPVLSGKAVLCPEPAKRVAESESEPHCILSY